MILSDDEIRDWLRSKREGEGEHRRMSTCEGCKYWSELIAEARGSTVVAMCLHPSKPRQYVYRGCLEHEPGEPVDLRARYVDGGDE